MRLTTLGAVVVSVLLGAGVGVAQTTTPSAESDTRSLVPVTGPSSAAEAARPELIPAVAQGTAPGLQAPRKGTTGHVAGTTGHTAGRPTKVVHKSGAKKTVKKATPPKHVATATPKTKQVATAKHQAPAAHQATVGKPIPLTKHTVPAKGAAPAQPVLPRV